MKLIIGLGNPGKKYERTRHNAGFLFLDKLATDWKESKKARALYCKTEINGVSVELLKPQTFMNDSGIAVAYAAKNHNLKPADIIIVHDDKDIPLGEYKIQTKNQTHPTHGVKSIIEHLGTQKFTRARVGIATPEMDKFEDKADFMLAKFSKDEIKTLNEVIEKVVAEIKHQLSS